MGPRNDVRPRVAAAVIIAGVAAFLAFHVAAAALYPGGTFCDARAPHYEVWGNYVCDVTQPRTPAGADNARAAQLATLAFAAIAVAFVPFWWRVGAMIAPTPLGSAERSLRGRAREPSQGSRRIGPRSRPAVRALGVLSAAATFVVARVPSARWPWLHVTAVF